jgi:transcription-repair coupling factor (superfamily II helicase)
MRRLLEFSQLKTRAERMGIESIERRGGGVNIKFHPGAAVDPARLMEIVRSAPGAQFTPAGILRLPVEAPDAERLLEVLREQLAALGG